MDASQLFNVDPLESRAARGHGVVTSMASGNDVILLGTSKGWIIHHDFALGDSQNLDFAPGRPGEQLVHQVFVEPGGSHCIATVVISGVAETFYMHAKWASPSPSLASRAYLSMLSLGIANSSLKDEICKSLKGYKNQIEQLKDEMNDATRGADSIRNDINALSQRYIVIDRNEECGVCKRKILGTRGAQQITSSYMSGGNIAPLYAFPCSHAFHSPCLIAHVTCCTTHAQAAYILDLQKQLSLMENRLTNDPTGEPVSSTTSIDKIRVQLDEAVASECPFCGDLMIREISLPFILPHESAEMASWAIKPQIPLLPKILPIQSDTIYRWIRL